jgi:hypothetical protein
MMSGDNPRASERESVKIEFARWDDHEDWTDDEEGEGDWAEGD